MRRFQRNALSRGRQRRTRIQQRSANRDRRGSARRRKIAFDIGGRASTIRRIRAARQPYRVAPVRRSTVRQIEQRALPRARTTSANCGWRSEIAYCESLRDGIVKSGSAVANGVANFLESAPANPGDRLRCLASFGERQRNTRVRDGKQMIALAFVLYRHPATHMRGGFAHTRRRANYFFCRPRSPLQQRAAAIIAALFHT